jgi:hypothetical protein
MRKGCQRGRAPCKGDKSTAGEGERQSGGSSVLARWGGGRGGGGAR